MAIAVPIEGCVSMSLIHVRTARPQRICPKTWGLATSGAGGIHCLGISKGESRVLLIDFPDSILKNISKIESRRETLLAVPANPSCARLIDCMDNAPFPRESRELLIEGKIYELLGFVARDLMCTEENDFFPPALKLEDRLIIARDILLERMKNPPGIPELADMVGTNECTLKSSFKRMYGTTVYGFIRSERLARARRLLEAGSCTVTEASQAVGYENLSHFSRNFQERYGIKPKAYAMASVS